MKIKKTGTTTSRILKIGQKARQLQANKNEAFLMLHRGVNAVVPINLDDIVNKIDFTSDDIQVYPGTAGKEKLRDAINHSYFSGSSNAGNILITPGGISGLDITIQNIEAEGLALPGFFWGSYAQLARLRGLSIETYNSLTALIKYPHKFTNHIVVICDPGNPLGEKHPDGDIYNAVERLYEENITVLIDSPYRRLFTDNDDKFHQKLSVYPNVIIVDSFSKSMGLSGQRIGFLHSTDNEFIHEANQRILYATNGVNAFAQELIYLMLTDNTGILEVSKFQQKTRAEIAKNISFLINNDLLSTEYYKNSKPIGIFACINRSEDELLKHGISSVSMAYFTDEPSKHEKYSRICASVPHHDFINYLSRLI